MKLSRIPFSVRSRTCAGFRLTFTRFSPSDLFSAGQAGGFLATATPFHTWRYQLKTRTTRTPAFWGYPPAASWLPTLLSHVGSQVKTRSNDLKDKGQGQQSSHVTHLLMLVIICTKYGKNPSWTVDATGRTRKVSRQTDRRTDRQGESNIPPLTSLRGV